MSGAGVDELALSYVARYGLDGFRELLQEGVSPDHFDPEFQPVWGYILRMHREFQTVPSVEAIATRYEHVQLVSVKKRDLKAIVFDLKQRYKYIKFLKTATDLAGQVGGDGWDKIDTILEKAVGIYTSLLHEGGNSQRLLDLFSEKAEEQLIAEMRERRDAKGIPTGIVGLDQVTGGFIAQRMVVSIGRTGSGKSWINLLHMANAVIHDYKVALFSLEMTMYEVAMRLYTIFSFILEPTRVLKNYELERGLVSEKKVKRFMGALRERYEGKLFIADAGHSSDPYTLERIMAEVEGLRPDMFWVDYLTLLKTSRSNDSSWEGVRELSRGIKHIAMSVKTVGGCSAQVNREATKTATDEPPRLEHIAFGDSLSHDANLVVSLLKPKKRKYIYWAVVKNRHGPETSPRKIAFDPDIGNFGELKKELNIATGVA